MNTVYGFHLILLSGRELEQLTTYEATSTTQYCLSLKMKYR